MLNANYQKADLGEVSKNQPQLTEIQQELLFNLLSKYDNLFQGKFGTWKGPLINIEIKADIQPYHAKPFRIPQSMYSVLKKEVERLIKIGVLLPNPISMWAAPSFAIPKKDGAIRFISDFWQLNKSTKRKPFPLPHIRDMIHSVGRMRWATPVDLSMGYYHMKLNKESRDVCTIILPWGKYCYNALPMKFCGSTEIFQHGHVICRFSSCISVP